ncbi:MAG: hypothetical protein DSZ31_02685, partial [Gammaproteobacteria bacterium]
FLDFLRLLLLYDLMKMEQTLMKKTNCNLSYIDLVLLTLTKERNFEILTFDERLKDLTLRK